MSSSPRALSPWKRARAGSMSSQEPGERTPLVAKPQNIAGSLSSSSHREPIRSFVTGGSRDTIPPTDSAEYARSVREESADLASYFLGDNKNRDKSRFASRQRTRSLQIATEAESEPSVDGDASVDSNFAGVSDTILETSEPPSPDEELDDEFASSLAGPSRSSSSDTIKPGPATKSRSEDPNAMLLIDESSRPSSARRDSESSSDRSDASELTPMLPRQSHRSHHQKGQNGNGRHTSADPESQRIPSSGWRTRLGGFSDQLKVSSQGMWQQATSTKTWNKENLVRNVVLAPISALPAVLVGLILNILDALSYGMILFPLGDPIFAGLGPAGISIFYVSTIVSQIIFSSGSVFKGGVGSELIEVVPFFHSMASTITASVGEEYPDEVISTTIFCFSFSAMITGLVFFTMGALKFGHLVGFIPRHILIGCIGGVGWFLVKTGLEVSARLEGSFNYDLDTLHLLFRSNTILLWTIPLFLAVVLFTLSSSSKLKDNQYLLPVFICLEPLIFWFFVVALDTLEPEHLRDSGWIFEAPPVGEPWWYFYTLFRFELIHWDAVAECIPAMLALTFFGVLHVPINVPALALQTGEDHANLDWELKLHGLSNFLAGCLGSIQNYLVYANSQFFIKSGGNSRLAGFMLAGFTAVVLVIGPVIIGFIPVMMVGTLIFVLGFELVLNALWDPRKKLNWAEYITVLTIVLVMGVYDFVIGIGVGVLLAFVSLVFQTSRVSAIRATFSGDTVGSTVRRNPSQQHYLRQVGRQIYLVKLAGYLFFGTVTSVEEKIRRLIDKEYNEQPIQYLILDLRQVTGLDYSAGEAFSTISRLLAVKNIVLVISGVKEGTPLDQDLRAVGLGSSSKDTEVVFCSDLNSALESCENEMLKTFYTNQEVATTSQPITPTGLDMPKQRQSNNDSDEFDFSSSPRQSHLQKAAREALPQKKITVLSRWQNFSEPLRLMLQIFHDLSDKNEDFWMRAREYFTRQEVSQGTILFRRGESAGGFYLLESGILRTEYDLPQGKLYESIVAGTTCGELPFFSETARTATAVAEQDAVVWKMGRSNWEKLQEEQPDVAQELLRIGLKLTSERMSSITGYILTTAG